MSGRRRGQAATAAALFAVAVVVLVALVDAGQHGAQAQEEPGQQTLDGEFLWRRDCVSCHGPSGNGTQFGPSLQGKGPAGVDFALRTGRMPLERLEDLGGQPYRAADLEVSRGPVQYEPGQIAAIVEHVRGFIEGPDVPAVSVATADLANGEQLFQANCASCHTWSGRGGALTGGRTAVDVTPSSPVEVVEAMRIGIGTMPAFSEETVSEEEARDIAAYVEYLKHPASPGGHPLAFLGPVAEGFVAWIFGIAGLLLIVRWIGSRA